MDAGKAKPKLEDKEPTKKQWKAFGELTSFIIGRAGLEPQWVVRVEIVPREKMSTPLTMAESQWVPNYRDLNIRTHRGVVIDRKNWVGILMHELVHAMTAPMADFALDSSSELTREHTINLTEVAVSEISNIMTNIFLDAYSKDIKQWLD